MRDKYSLVNELLYAFMWKWTVKFYFRVLIRLSTIFWARPDEAGNVSFDFLPIYVHGLYSRLIKKYNPTHLLSKRRFSVWNSFTNCLIVWHGIQSPKFNLKSDAIINIQTSRLNVEPDYMNVRTDCILLVLHFLSAWSRLFFETEAW